MRSKKIISDILSTVEISGVFFTDYLPALEPGAVKVYMYIVYASCKDMDYTNETVALSLNLDVSVVDAAIIQLEYIGLITRDSDVIYINDLAQKEIDKLYRRKTTSRPDEFYDIPDKTKRERAQAQKAISDRFFSGQMPPSWYTEIDSWYEKYGFDPETVLLLFQHCVSNKVLTKPYLNKVAESWGDKHHIKNAKQVESYLAEYDEFCRVTKAISKKLKWRRELNVYEEEVVDKWFYTYGYRFDIIELALKKSVSKSSTSLAYFDAIITKWYENGLKTVEQILEFEAKRSREYQAKQTENKDQRGNYDERKYDDDFLNSFVKNSGGTGE